MDKNHILELHLKEQRERQAEDMKKWPERDEGVYRGFRWLALRPGAHHGTPHWCGYVDLTPARKFLDSNPDHMEELENRTHYGFTGGKEGMSGFDCAHCNDYFYRFDLNGTLNDLSFYDLNATYKDHDYVLKRLFDMIDYLADNLHT